MLTACKNEKTSEKFLVKSTEEVNVKLQLVKLVDTVANVTEYYSIDELEQKQGKSWVINYAGDTTMQCYYYNDTVLNYYYIYENNSLTAIKSRRIVDGRYGLQDWIIVDSLGQIEYSKSCFIDWNYDFSRILRIRERQINFDGRFYCGDKTIQGIKYQSILNGIPSDTLSINADFFSISNSNLVEGINRIELHVQTIFSDSSWLGHEYIIFVGVE